MAIAAAVEPRALAGGEQRYVIPPGTAQRALAGESIEDVLPQRVGTVVGRPLVVENRDDVRHTFGPFSLDPGQSWRRTFAASGDVQIACSLYPTTGFTIAVAPPPVPAVRTTALLAVWLALLAMAVAVGVGGVGVAVGSGHGAVGDVGMGVGDVDAAIDGVEVAVGNVVGGHGAVARSWRTAGTALALLPPFAGAAAALAILRLSRTAPWADVAASRTTWLWALSLCLALAAAWCGRRAAAGVPVGTSVTGVTTDTPVGFIAALSLAGPGLALLALAAALSPLVGAGTALTAALATAGAGLCGATVLMRIRADSDVGAAARRRLMWTVAVPGAVLLAVALPGGAATPPVQALAAAPKLVAAIGLAWLARSLVRRGEVSAAPVVTGASVVAALWSLGLLYGALLGHVNAVTLPTYGNPVPMSTASAARGAALWAAECAACHDPGDASAFAALPDDVLLEAITFGRREQQRSSTAATEEATAVVATSASTVAAASAASSALRISRGAMPAFKYRLDVFQRGDVVNYVRGAEGGGSAVR